MKKEFIFLILVISFIAFASSDFAYSSCCERTTSGDICVSLEDESSCIGEYAPGSDCKETAFCSLGCCYNSNDGTFEKNVLESSCPFTWDSSDPTCTNIPTLEQGCCILTNNQIYTTQKSCEILSEKFSLSTGETNWDKSISELECSFVEEPAGLGACVLENKRCSHTYFEECQNSNGEFFENSLCTNKDLDTICEPSELTTCQIESGEDGVYFQDTCGNIANIYDSSKIENQNYWNFFIDKKDSCNPNSANANSAICGNCNRFKGSICSPPEIGESSPTTYGNNFCKPTSCTTEDGTTYLSGETWCVYDGKIGEGDDTVGSLHFLYECQNGEIVPRQCADYRNEICKQVDVTDPNSGEVISGAKCEPNDWEECVNINKENSNDAEKVEELCSQNEQCFLRAVEIDDVRFSICVPQYPPGFNFNSNEGASDFEEQLDICSIGTQTCNRIEYRKGLLDDYDCEVNCACGKPELTEEMNNICRSLGDCGASVNYIGELTNEGFEGYYKDKKRDLNLREDYLESLKNYYNNFINYDFSKEVSNEDQLKLEELYESGYGSSFIFIREEFGTTLRYISPIKLFGHSFAGNNPFNQGVSLVTESINLLMFGEYKNKKSKFKAFKGRNVDKIIYTCSPWQQPLGGENCELCNEGDVPCSEYRCSSLGAACSILNKGGEDQKCYWENERDSTSPLVELGDETSDYEIDENPDGSLTISPKDSSCFDAYEDINITIKTNEFARCKYSEDERTEFENMIPISNIWAYNHTFSYYLIDPSHGTSSGLNVSIERTLYFKCIDKNGNGEKTNSYLEINMCVNEGPDITSPEIDFFKPESGHKTAYQKQDQLVNLYVNEPAECKWSKNDETYAEMPEENLLLCANDPDEKRPLGFECETLLPLDSDSNTFYFRCLDQPWLGEPLENGTDLSANRKESLDSEIYEINRIEEQISIDELIPGNDSIKTETLVKKLDIKVETSGGGEKHTCYYSKESFDKLLRMFRTGETNSHTQPNIQFVAGENNIYVECRDEAGDKTRATTTFNLEYGDSSTSSLISRVWQENGKLSVITSSPVECKISTETCNFNYENASSFGSDSLHQTSIRKGRNYFVKCLDGLGNPPNTCSLRVIPT